MWTLLAAWCSANVPFGVALCILSWSTGAVHFDHQAQLKRQVEVLLHRRAAAPAAHLQFAPQPNLPVPHPPPAAWSARLDPFLSPHRCWLLPPPGRREHRFQDAWQPEDERSEPLLDPPRPVAAI